MGSLISIPSYIESTTIKAQIWQHPAAIKGAWDRTFVFAYEPKQKEYISAFFNNGLDYVMEPGSTLTKQKIMEVIEKAKNDGYLPYNDRDLRHYARSYGIQDYV